MKKPSHLILLAVFLLTAVTSFAAEEKFNFGEQWTKSSIPEKMRYMEGYQTGYTVGVMNATKQFVPTATEEEKEAAFKKASMIFSERRLGKDMLVNVVLLMDQLYKDPANQYIDTGVILELALDKTRGRDISEDLLQQQKSAAGESK